ncbi:amino acid-binding protein [Methanococcus voltae]|uniref:Amino acid-binding ACT domain protein n=1 Tax=Methanococcus voltae (strain ATCC BAA-1334 / A3) TaxID=456320 RepID=D7DTT5_METV3|nr:amino acid-binding protein [Methanococcus voltae]MCS3900343.1 hypothetical protein [Methanococcus voltae]
MIAKQLSVFLENKSGRLYEVMEILEKENINIVALSVADTTEYGILRMVVSDPEKALKALKDNLFSVGLTDIVCICIPNVVGSFSKASRYLSEEGISIEYMYAFALNDKALAVLRTEDNEKCIEVLTNKGIEVVSSERLKKI